MLKQALFLLGVLSTAHSRNTSGQQYGDTLFSALDRGLTHTLAYHYLWPFSQLVRAAAALEADEGLELLQIQSDDTKYEINLNVKRFKPDELRIKVKNQYIIVEGKHREKMGDRPIMTNHFVQRFALPPGCKPEEVTAVLREDGVLAVSAPKHKLPPPPPERDVPIEVRPPIEKTTEKQEEKAEETTAEIKEMLEEKKEIDEKKEISEDKKETVAKKKDLLEKKKDSPKTTSESPLWQHLMDTTTHIGKIRKKELKSTTKIVKENEVAKGGEGNGLDYMLIDTEADE